VLIDPKDKKSGYGLPMMAVSPRIHVLHVLPSLGVGGMELALSRIINGMDPAIFEHSIVCLRGSSKIGDYLNRPVNIYCMKAKPNELGLPVKLLKLIRAINPSLIHARNWSAWPEVTFARLFHKHRIPVIFSFHGFDTIHSVPFRRRLISKLTAMVTDRIFTVAEVSRQVMTSQLGLKASRIFLIPNGIDTDKFHPVFSKSKHRDAIIVGSVGNLTPVKNHILLVHACSELIRAGFDIQLRIAGTGPEEKIILDTARSLGIQEQVDLLGHVTDIDRFLQSLDIFALSSSSEAHPNALLEAMATGLPCVAPEVGGIPNVFDGGSAGLLYEVNNKDDMANCMKQLIMDSDHRETISHMARNRVCSLYSIQKMLVEYQSLYLSLAKKQ